MSNHNFNNERKKEQTANAKPNETGGFYFSSSVKIFDPNSHQIIIQKRGDV